MPADTSHMTPMQLLGYRNTKEILAEYVVCAPVEFEAPGLVGIIRAVLSEDRDDDLIYGCLQALGEHVYSWNVGPSVVPRTAS